MRKEKLEAILKKSMLNYQMHVSERNFFLTISELGIVGTSLVLPVMIPCSVPVSVALTTCLAVLRSTNSFITKKKQQTFQN